jgi:hypothetical protein
MASFRMLDHAEVLEAGFFGPRFLGHVDGSVVTSRPGDQAIFQ